MATRGGAIITDLEIPLTISGRRGCLIIAQGSPHPGNTGIMTGQGAFRAPPTSWHKVMAMLDGAITTDRGIRDTISGRRGCPITAQERQHPVNIGTGTSETATGLNGPTPVILLRNCGGIREHSPHEC